MSEGADARIGPISPLFIVRDVRAAIAFYQRIGFEVRFVGPQGEEPFFAIVGRQSAEILLKELDDVGPMPNGGRRPCLAWDVFVYAEDPDALARELEAGGIALDKPVADNDDGLRGFEIRDADGYLLYFGRTN